MIATKAAQADGKPKGLTRNKPLVRTKPMRRSRPLPPAAESSPEGRSANSAKGTAGAKRPANGLRRSTPMPRGAWTRPSVPPPGSPEAASSAPSLARPARKRIPRDPRNLRGAAARFHDRVFARFGPTCYWFSLCHDPRPSHDAAHVIPKSALGGLRYASEEFARPAHRTCHERQHARRPGYAWDYADRLSALLAHNALEGVVSLKRVPDLAVIVDILRAAATPYSASDDGRILVVRPGPSTGFSRARARYRFSPDGALLFVEKIPA